MLSVPPLKLREPTMVLLRTWQPGTARGVAAKNIALSPGGNCSWAYCNGVRKPMDPGLRVMDMISLGQGRARRMIKPLCATVALPLSILGIVISAVGPADSKHRVGASGGALEAKISYCQDCHGPSGQGYLGYFPIPRLAGQQPEYLENQLRAFVERRRANSIMFGVAHVLSPAMISGLATRFKVFNPKPLGDGPRGLVANGRKIFQDGVPDANVAACAACHGPEATGVGQIPRLAGQLYPYLVKTLVNWSKERGQNFAQPDTSLIMEPIAHSLNKAQVEAIAAYLSQLR
jgi:cytochrome c553